MDKEEDVDMEAATEQKAGKSGDGAENELNNNEEGENLTGEDNSAAEEKNEKSIEDEAREKANESLKQIGESLKEFHRRRQEILEAEQDDNEANEQSANQNLNEFQHNPDTTADDLQALELLTKTKFNPSMKIWQLMKKKRKELVIKSKMKMMLMLLKWMIMKRYKRVVMTMALQHKQ